MWHLCTGSKKKLPMLKEPADLSGYHVLDYDATIYYYYFFSPEISGSTLFSCMPTYLFIYFC